MKKGNVFPRTAARWNAYAVPSGGRNAPTWLTVSSLYAVYLNNEGGTPFPRVVTQTACGPARWSYEARDGWIVWRGPWNDGVRNGFWERRQRPDVYGRDEIRNSLTVVMDTFRLEYEFSSAPGECSATWSTLGDNLARFDTNITHDIPWVSWLYATYHPLRYSEIRALGEDEDDIRPLTWNG